MFEKREKPAPRKNYICPKCKDKAILEYTERFRWQGSDDRTRAELKCPECNRKFWKILEKKKEVKNESR